MPEPVGFAESWSIKNDVVIVYSHGGPGSGCGPTSKRYFDPAVYKIIVFDQRGAGKSKPTAERKVLSLILYRV